MIVGIDATNLRAGGGVTHLVGILSNVHLPCHGVDRVIVWGGRATLDLLPTTPGVELRHAPAADGPLPQRVWWQHVGLAKAARDACDLLFIPGGAGTERFAPRVVMSRNMLPFETREAWRFGVSRVFARLMALRWAQARAFARADGVIFLSEHAHRIVRAQLPEIPRASTVIPHGVSERFRQPPRPQEALSAYGPKRPFRLLYVSTIGPYKHQEAVVEAVSELRGEGLPVTMDFVGGHDTEASLARFKALRLTRDPKGEYLTYTPRVPHEALPARYRNADAFVYASSCENMPNILVEAMASGLPIACSDRDPMPEVLMDAGVYFDPECAPSMASSVRRLLGNQALRTRLSAAAFRRAEMYSWSRCADETFAFLARVGGASRATMNDGTTVAHPTNVQMSPRGC